MDLEIILGIGIVILSFFLPDFLFFLGGKYEQHYFKKHKKHKEW